MDDQNPGHAPNIIRPNIPPQGDPVQQQASMAPPAPPVPLPPVAEVSLPSPVVAAQPVPAVAPVAPDYGAVQQQSPPTPPAPIAAAPTSPPAPDTQDFSETNLDDQPVEQPQVQSSVPDSDGPEVSWEAPEFIDHQKSSKWYVVFAVVSLVIIVLGYVITRDVFSVVILSILAVLSGVIASRKPRVVNHGLGVKGIYVGEKFYPYNDFNGFAIIEEGKMFGIDFMPLKRFAPMLSIYCESEHEDEVKEFLARFLPFSNHKRSVIDGLMQRIHF